ncbi:S-adenosyl-L-methionine-dependent methyltransferase [Pisolithus croceorrhizus]|nr:S-adenosyl-L-methionine-dependent methyltransferase [Pisolithus croceorrhizus]
MNRIPDDSQLDSVDSEVSAEDIEEINALTELGTTLIQAVLEKEPLTNVQDLIDAGAPLWFQDNEGISPLHAAAYVGSEQLVKMFLDEGAVWNAVDNLGNTAGDIALSMNNEECYKLIRDAGIRAGLLLAVLSSRSSLVRSPLALVIDGEDNTAAASNVTFLASHLQYTTDTNGQEICLLKLKDDTEIGVMMGWEREIMCKTVDELCSDHPRLKEGLRVLNVGFGLGIIDSLLQGISEPPSLHVIIEAHPDVLAHMRERGWHSKPGVKVMTGKWQDVIQSKEFRDLGKFDVVYTDTFAEDYQELHKFFKLLPSLLAGPEGRFSFFNGLGATNALLYDVYSRISECHLSDIGADVRWSFVRVDGEEDQGRWERSREYFTQPLYRLPIAQLRSKET